MHPFHYTQGNKGPHITFNDPQDPRKTVILTGWSAVNFLAQAKQDAMESLRTPERDAANNVVLAEEVAEERGIVFQQRGLVQECHEREENYPPSVKCFACSSQDELTNLPGGLLACKECFAVYRKHLLKIIHEARPGMADPHLGRSC